MTGRYVVLLSISALSLFAYQNCSTPTAQEALSYGTKSPVLNSSSSTGGVFGSSNDPGTGYSSDGVLGCALINTKTRYQATETVSASLACNFNLTDPSRPFKAKWFERDANGAYFEVPDQNYWGVGSESSPAIWEMPASKLSIGSHTRYVQLCDVNSGICNLKTAAITFQVYPECGLSAIYNTVPLSSGGSVPTGGTVDPYLKFKVWVNATSDQLRAAGITVKSMGLRLHYATTQKPNGYSSPDPSYVLSEAIPYPGFNFSMGKSPLTPDQVFYVQAAIYDKSNNMICESFEFAFSVTK